MKRAYNEAYWENYRAELVESKVAHSMYSDDVPATDNYSFRTFTNLQEYFHNMPEKDVQLLVERLEQMKDNDDMMVTFGRAVYCGALEYWEALALEAAEKDTPEARQLYEEQE